VSPPEDLVLPVHVLPVQVNFFFPESPVVSLCPVILRKICVQLCFLLFLRICRHLRMIFRDPEQAYKSLLRGGGSTDDMHPVLSQSFRSACSLSFLFSFFLFAVFLRSPSGFFIASSLEDRKPCRKKVDHCGACQHEGSFSPVRILPDLSREAAAGLRDQLFSVLCDDPAEPITRQMGTIQILQKPDDTLPVHPPGDFSDLLLLPLSEGNIIRVDLPLSAAGEITGRSDTMKARIVCRV